MVHPGSRGLSAAGAGGILTPQIQGATLAPEPCSGGFNDVDDGPDRGDIVKCRVLGKYGRRAVAPAAVGPSSGIIFTNRELSGGPARKHPFTNGRKIALGSRSVIHAGL